MEVRLAARVRELLGRAADELLKRKEATAAAVVAGEPHEAVAALGEEADEVEAPAADGGCAPEAARKKVLEGGEKEGESASEEAVDGAATLRHEERHGAVVVHAATKKKSERSCSAARARRTGVREK